MRVLMICKDSGIGGTYRSCVELSEALVERGVEVAILAPRVEGPTIEATGCEVVRPQSLGRRLSTELSPGLAWSAFRAKADIVHVHLPCPLAVPGLWLRRGTPLVVTYHCDLDRRLGNRRRLRGAGSAPHPARRRRARVERGAPSLADARRDRRSLPSRPARRESSPHRSRVGRGRHGRAPAGAAPALVLFVGRLAYYKGLEVLVEAMALVPGSARLVVVGEGAERGQIQAAIDARGLSERVTLIGHVPDSELAPYLHAAELFVLPSTSHAEAFGLVLVEAALAGLPSISTEVSTGTSWVNRHGESGLIVPPRNPRALGAAIETLLASEPLRRAMGERARQRAVEELTAAHCGEGARHLSAGTFFRR